MRGQGRRPSAQPERAQAIRRRIARGALPLFLKKGFGRTGVREIAVAADVSVGTIFNYFDTKENVLFAIVSEMQQAVLTPLRRAAEDCRRRVNAGGDPEHALLTLLEDYVRGIDRWRRELVLAYQEIRSLPQPQRRQLLDGERRIRDVLAEVIQLGVERGKFSGGDLRFRAHAIQLVLQSWATRRWALDDTQDLDSFIQTAERAIFSMLRGAGAPEPAQTR